MVAGAPFARTKIHAAAALIAGVMCGVGLPRRAGADGALPASSGILVPADRPDEIVLATNFGLILSEDGGRTWQWTCEQPATSMGYLYGVGPAPRDRVYALSPEAGLAYTDDGGCSWQLSGGALATAIASDYFVDRSNPDRVLTIAAGLDGNGDILPQSVYGSDDGGQTFQPTPLYTAPPSTNVVSLEIARSNPNVVYLGMYGYPGRHPVLLRSEDGGQSWTSRDVEAGLGESEFRILAIDPDDPDRLYLRVIVLGTERVVVTTDAGATFVTGVEVVNGALSGFARLASGTVLVAGLTNLTGGGTSGVGYRSTDRGATFHPWLLSPQPHIQGLAERDGVLYLAGKNYSDGWALALSSDEGATIVPVATYEDVRSIKPCAQQTCAGACAFEVMAAVWSSEVCSGLPPKPPAESGCGCDAAGIGARAGGVPAGGGGIVSALLVWTAAGCRRRSSRQCKRRGVD